MLLPPPARNAAGTIRAREPTKPKIPLIRHCVTPMGRLLHRRWCLKVSVTKSTKALVLAVKVLNRMIRTAKPMSVRAA